MNLLENDIFSQKLWFCHIHVQKNVSLFYNIPSLFIARVKEAIALASVNGESMSKSAP